MNDDPFGISKKGVVAGRRVAPKFKGGKRKNKPPVGKGNYVKAPLLRDKLTSPRWMANAVVNNPGHTLGIGGVTGGTYVLGHERRKVAKRDDRKTAAGAAVGAGAGHFARVGADYGSKTVAERQFKPLTTKGNYGPYTDTPHKPVLNKYKRTPKGDVRQKAKMFDENFPKGIPSHNARKVGVALNRKGAVAGVAAGGAVLGGALAGKKKRVKKSYISFEDFAKAEKKKKSGAAIAGAGATVSGVGYVAGGTPKKKVSLEGVNFDKPKNTRQLIGDKVRVAQKFGQGGVLGFRSTVHQAGLYGFNQAKTKDEWAGAPKDQKTAFKHGRNAGKIAPEVKVIRHMAGGRKAANAAWVGGAGVAAYGAAKHRKETVKKRRTKAQNEALEGAGQAGAAVSAGGGALLSSQKRSWAKTASKHIDEAGKLAPNTAGRRKGRFGRVGMEPSVTDGAVIRNPGLLKGVSLDAARKVGEHRGAAAQARHFSHVYGNAGKGTVAIGGAASVAALASARKHKQKVSKSMSPFGVDHG